MKKQLHPGDKAYLIRRAFYLLLLFAVWAMPFALAQQSAIRRSVGRPGGALSRGPEVPQLTSARLGAQIMVAPAPPSVPQTVLYDQYNNAGIDVTVSATFTDFPTYRADLADDFVVPTGQTWTVQSIDANGAYLFGLRPAIDW